MEERVLGDSDLKVSPIGFGTWAIGGTDWGPVDDEKSIVAIHQGLDSGITLFDTADFYGFGHAERILAQALGERREKVVIATKGGLRWDGDGENVRRDSSPDYLEAALHASLKRLKTDYIDLYQVHWPDPNTEIVESLSRLQALREAGKIRHIGVSNFNIEQMEAALSTGPIVSLQSPLSLLDRSLEGEILPFVAEQKMGFLAYSPLAMGLLTGKYVAEQVFSEGDVRGWFPLFRGEAFRKHLDFVEALKPIAQGEGKTLAQLAINWVVHHSSVTSALVGARHIEQVRENVGGVGWTISERAKERIGQRLGEA